MLSLQNGTSEILPYFLVQFLGSIVFGGLAYGSTALMRDHYLNIHAGRISIYRDRPDDFLKWAAEDAKKEDMFRVLQIEDDATKKEWKERLTFYESSPVPRLIYKLYLRDRFNDAYSLTKGKDTVELIWSDSRVDDLDECDTFVRLQFDPDERSGHWDVDIAILCTGHVKPIVPEALQENVLNNLNFFSHPYSGSLAASLTASNNEDRMLVLGSGLSSFDALTTAVLSQYRGSITTCSRHGLMHATYADNHSHAILPSVFDDLFASVRTATQMNHAIEQAIALAKSENLSKYIQEASEFTIPERVLKAIEPQVIDFVKSASVSEVRAFLGKRSWLTTMRTSVVPIVAEIVRRVDAEQLLAAVLSINVDDANSLLVTFRTEEDGAVFTRSFTTVVCCMGYDPDYTQPSGLWGKLRAKQLALPHGKTGLGIQVGNNGRLALVRNGKSVLSRSLYAVGTMRQGDEIQKRGRLGAFTFSIGTIRNQCLMAALSVLKQIELPHYHTMLSASQEAIKDDVEKMLGPTGRLRRDYVSLIAHIADEGFLPNTPGKLRTDEKLKANIAQLCNREFESESDRSLFLHELWHGARIRAGRLVTDIRRLSDRYEVVREYRPGIRNRCIAENKDCKDFLRRLITTHEVESASLLVFSRAEMQLRMFANHLRVSKQSPTAYGEFNAGKLVRAYCEKIDRETLFSDPRLFHPDEIIPYYDGANRLIGMVIPDYNVTSGMKPAFKGDASRTYSHLLVVLIVDQVSKEVLGVLYLEAFRRRDFQPQEVGIVYKECLEIVPHVSRVIKTWEPTSDVNHQDRVYPPGTVFESSLDCSGGNFSGTIMQKATVLSNMSGANLSRTDCTGATFEGTEMTGAYLFGSHFDDAHFRRANMSRCEVYGSHFDRAAFTDRSVLSGRIERSSFVKAMMNGVNLSGGTFRSVDFSAAILQGADLTGATFDSACVWEGADISGCKVDKTALAGFPDKLREKYIDTLIVFDDSDFKDEPITDESLEVPTEGTVTNYASKFRGESTAADVTHRSVGVGEVKQRKRILGKMVEQDPFVAFTQEKLRIHFENTVGKMDSPYKLTRDEWLQNLTLLYEIGLQIDRSVLSFTAIAHEIKKRIDDGKCNNIACSTKTLTRCRDQLQHCFSVLWEEPIMLFASTQAKKAMGGFTSDGDLARRTAIRILKASGRLKDSVENGGDSASS